MRRLVLLSLVALALAACGRDAGRAFLDTRTPPSLGPRFWPPDGWAWGTIEVQGAPEIRYGVAGPGPSPSGDAIIIVSGYGESAEVYFETVRDLNARGWTVWVIEPHGQGGSGRFSGWRDTGRSAGFDKDAAAIRALVEQVIRPSMSDQVVLAAHGSSTAAALGALAGGLRRIDRLVAWSPDVELNPGGGPARQYARFGLGGMRGSGAAWKRPTGRITERGTLPAAWQLANPDLRMGGPGWSWLAARDAALPPAERLARISQPVAMSGPEAGGGPELCRRLPRCAFTPAPAREHLAADPARRAWIDRLAPRPDDLSDHGA